MGRAKRENQRAREPHGEPTSQQASECQTVTDFQRTRIWLLHLRGMTKVRIAADVGLHRRTVAKVIAAHYVEVVRERKESAARMLDGAVQRMRLVQEQAWTDHDEDDRREREVLSLALSGASAASADANVRTANNAISGGKGKDASASTVRFQSQRSQYLRVILDAEKEIARLEGLYEGQFDIEGAIGFVVVKRAPHDANGTQGAEKANSRSSSQLDPEPGQSGQIATSAPNTRVLDAGMDGAS